MASAAWLWNNDTDAPLPRITEVSDTCSFCHCLTCSSEEKVTRRHPHRAAPPPPPCSGAQCPVQLQNQHLKSSVLGNKRHSLAVKHMQICGCPNLEADSSAVAASSMLHQAAVFTRWGKDTHSTFTIDHWPRKPRLHRVRVCSALGTYKHWCNLLRLFTRARSEAEQGLLSPTMCGACSCGFGEEQGR